MFLSSDLTGWLQRATAASILSLDIYVLLGSAKAQAVSRWFHAHMPSGGRTEHLVVAVQRYSLTLLTLTTTVHCMDFPLMCFVISCLYLLLQLLFFSWYCLGSPASLKSQLILQV
jgi:hypothetical protein